MNKSSNCPKLDLARTASKDMPGKDSVRAGFQRFNPRPNVCDLQDLSEGSGDAAFWDVAGMV